MRSFNYIVICMVFFICSVGFNTRLGATPKEKAVAAKEEAQSQSKIHYGTPPIQEQKIALNPFFRLQSNGSKVWVERILVTFTMASPKNHLEYDFDSPTFRKMFYDLFQSGELETNIQAQAVAELKRQVGMNVKPAVEISRSVLIMR